MKTLVLFAALAVSLALPSLAHAQGRGPGGGSPPAGQRPPGPPGGSPGGPGGGPGNGPGGPPPSNSGAAAGAGAGSAQSAAPRNALQIGPTGRWWDDKNVVRSVGISSTQQRRMDSVFDSNKPAILASYKTLMAEQNKLAALNKTAQPNQAAVFAQIDSVNQARAALQKATTQMLLQIRSEMAPEQVQKLEQIH